MFKMDTITILSIVSIVITGVYLFIAREKSANDISPSNFGIMAIVTMMIGMMIGYRSGSGWAYAIIAHGALGLAISTVRLLTKK
jgi:hypothetical protein